MYIVTQLGTIPRVFVSDTDAIEYRTELLEDGIYSMHSEQVPPTVPNKDDDAMTNK